MLKGEDISKKILWASRDTTLSRTIFIAVFEQFFVVVQISVFHHWQVRVYGYIVSRTWWLVTGAGFCDPVILTLRNISCYGARECATTTTSSVIGTAIKNRWIYHRLLPFLIRRFSFANRATAGESHATIRIYQW